MEKNKSQCRLASSASAKICSGNDSPNQTTSGRNRPWQRGQRGAQDCSGIRRAGSDGQENQERPGLEQAACPAEHLGTLRPESAGLVLLPAGVQVLDRHHRRQFGGVEPDL